MKTKRSRQGRARQRRARITRRLRFELLEDRRLLALDFGDAPAPYPTVLADDGARHTIDPTGPWLGRYKDAPDSDWDGHPSPTYGDIYAYEGAYGDNVTGADDENGLLGADFVIGMNSTYVVWVRGAGGVLDAWIDFDRDGRWTEAERIYDDHLEVGNHSLRFTVPETAIAGGTYARFRISRQGDLSPTGLAPDGEVEDHFVTLRSPDADFGDAPWPYPTLREKDGARHLLEWNSPTGRQYIERDDNIWIGSKPADANDDGMPDDKARGDDGGHDEEPIKGLSQTVLFSNRENAFELEIGGNPGYLDAWIDFEQNGSWTELDRIYGGPVVLGKNIITFTIPASARSGDTFARFRVSTQGGLDPKGEASDGEVEDHEVWIAEPHLDFGDAPVPYQTKFVHDGARHEIDRSGPWLGTTAGSYPDPEHDGQPDPLGLGDDFNGSSDEKGITLPELSKTLYVGEQAKFTVEIGNKRGVLDAWIDFDRDGAWSNDERIYGGSLSAASHVITFLVPENSVEGATFGRFRVSTLGGLGPAGAAADGEVEDHGFVIVRRPTTYDFGDAPAPNRTLLAENGARHGWGGPWLGDRSPDMEADGQPDAAAQSDDAAGTDDEDGVVLPDSLEINHPATIQVLISAFEGEKAYLKCWIDWTGGGFSSVDALISAGPLDAGLHTFTALIPSDHAKAGPTSARFRVSSTPDMDSTGEVADGEVEDYAITIVDRGKYNFGTAPYPYPTLRDRGGAYHDKEPNGYKLAGGVTVAYDGSPNEYASGQSESFSQGVFIPNLAPGQDATLGFRVWRPYESQGTSYLSLWIDFDQDGSWDDPGEHVLSNAVAEFGGYESGWGEFVFTIHVPANAESGWTCSRARLSLAPLHAPGYGGYGGFGEVRDNMVLVEGAEALNDLGDAPDSTNNWSMPMSAYPPSLNPLLLPSGVMAHFPTAYVDGQSPYGPMHRDADGLAHFNSVTLETNADFGVDEDGGVHRDGMRFNIHPGMNRSDGDWGDDGVSHGTLNHGAANVASFDITLSEAISAPFYVNAWYDWNRDGDWDDTMPLPSGQTAPEWAIQNFELTGLAVGANGNIASPSFLAWHPNSGGTPLPIWARFTLAEQPWQPVWGAGGAGPQDGYFFGETEDYYLSTYQQTFDYGDAPAPYPTKRSDNGARHAVGGPWLSNGGFGPNWEDDAKQSPNNADEFEHGLVFGRLHRGAPASATVHVSGGGGYVDAWLDFNADGSWQDAERIYQGYLGDGKHAIDFRVPADALVSSTWARIRINSAESLGPTGSAGSGEVEDHYVAIKDRLLDYGDAQEPLYATRRESDGARHFWGSDGPYLGPTNDRPDDEPDGQPTWGCSGDDTQGTDDEDGVAIPVLYRGRPGYVPVIVGQAGFLDAWIDFDSNGLWVDGERIFGGWLDAGNHQIDFDVPLWAELGESAAARFRISTQGGLSPLGAAEDGEVEDHVVTILDPPMDYGDAPHPYATTQADGGPRHVLSTSGPWLGPADDKPDPDWDGRPSGMADGDDNAAGDDEDGVTIPLLRRSEKAKIQLQVGGGGFVRGWIDWRQDGRFDEPGDVVVAGPFAAGIHEIVADVPYSARPGETFARFRVTSQDAVTAFGRLEDGEVEDYRVWIDYPDMPPNDYGDAPAPYPTLAADDGASHDIAGWLALGWLTDGEANGQPTEQADGDDTAGLADEDGLVSESLLVAGQPWTMDVLVYKPQLTPAWLNAWIDWDQNGDWLGPDERVVHQTVQNGLNSITIGVPDSVPLGAFFLRLRLSTQENLAPTGTAPDGEVEDYRILVDTPPVADAGGPYRIDAGQDLTLDARLSTDPDVAAGDGLVAYAWDLNSDGVYDWTTAQAVSTVPWTTLAGLGLAYPVDPDTGLPSNVVRLRVTDSFGAADFAVTSLTIVCPWHNADDPYDVNGIDGATALDVLIIINYINANPGDAEPPAPPASPPPYYDVNGDNQVTALDVLLVINDINAHIAGSPMGEAEATAAGLAAAPVLPPRNGISRRLSGCPAASQSPPWRFACPPAIWPEVTADLAASLTDDCPHPVSLIVRSPACRAWDGAATILENDWFDLAADVDLPGLAGEEELGRHLHHLNRRDPTATAKP